MKLRFRSKSERTPLDFRNNRGSTENKRHANRPACCYYCVHNSGWTCELTGEKLPATSDGLFKKSCGAYDDVMNHK